MQMVVVYPKGVFGATEDKVMFIDIPEQHGFETEDYLDIGFRMMNAVDGSYTERYLKKYRCRSMSVGDLVCIEGAWFIVKPVGWQQLDDSVRIAELNEVVRNWAYS